MAEKDSLDFMRASDVPEEEGEDEPLGQLRAGRSKSLGTDRPLSDRRASLPVDMYVVLDGSLVGFCVRPAGFTCPNGHRM